MSKNKRRNLLLSIIAIPSAILSILFSSNAYASDPISGSVRAGILTKIQAEVALIYAWLEERVEVWNQYIEKVDNGLKFLSTISKTGEYIKRQLDQVASYVRSFEKGDRSFLSMRFRKFNLEAQEIVVYCRDLKRQAIDLRDRYDRAIDSKVKNKEEADKIKSESAKRAAVDVSAKAYDSIAQARLASSKLKEDMEDVEEKTLAAKDTKIKADVFDSVTKRSRGMVAVAQVEQQALTNELLAAILQTLTNGKPLLSHQNRETYTIESIYDFMQGKGNLEKPKKG